MASYASAVTTSLHSLTQPARACAGPAACVSISPAPPAQQHRPFPGPPLPPRIHGLPVTAPSIPMTTGSETSQRLRGLPARVLYLPPIAAVPSRLVPEGDPKRPVRDRRSFVAILVAARSFSPSTWYSPCPFPTTPSRVAMPSLLRRQEQRSPATVFAQRGIDPASVSPQR